MNKISLILLLIILVTCGCDQLRPPAIMSSEEIYISLEGWTGERMVINGQTTFAALDSRLNDNRKDLWRYYQDDRLIRELHDLDADDLIDVATRHDFKSGVLIRIERFLTSARQATLTVEYLGDNSWRQHWDRNTDGKSDFEFYFSGTESMLTTLNIEPTKVLDMREQIPRARWTELRLDEDHDGTYDHFIPYLPLPHKSTTTARVTPQAPEQPLPVEDDPLPYDAQPGQ